MMEIVALVISFFSVGVAIGIGWVQISYAKKMDRLSIEQDEREKARHKDYIYCEATRFIQKYNTEQYRSEMELLPLCVIAYKYDLTYPYKREIYRDFCSLSEEIQNEILARREISLKSKKESSDFFYKKVHKLKDVIFYNYLDSYDLYNEGGKYLKYALEHFGNEEVPDVRCKVDTYFAEQMQSSYWIGKKRKDMSLEDHIVNLLSNNKFEKTIDVIVNQNTSLGEYKSDTLLGSFICCEVAKYASLYSNEQRELYGNNWQSYYSGKKYMEDLFLEALLYMDVLND